MSTTTREYTTQRMQSSFATAMRNVISELEGKLEELPDDWHLILWYDFCVPAAVALIFSSLGLYMIHRLWRFFFPPSPATLHQEGLRALHNGKNIQTVVQLWRQAAVRSQYAYTPVVVSLAALYVYRCKEPDKALQVLKDARVTTGKTEADEPAEFRAIQKDAQAMLAGHHDMVLTPLAETEFLSALQAVAR